MPILYQWCGNIDNLTTSSWLISPKVVQMIGAEKDELFIKLTVLPSPFISNLRTWRQLFNVSLWHCGDITGTPQRVNSPVPWLIDQQLVHSNDKVVSVSKSRITGGFQGWGEVQAMVPRYRYRYLGVGQVQVQVQVHDFSKVPRYRYRYSWKVPKYRYRYFVWWCH